MTVFFRSKSESPLKIIAHSHPADIALSRESNTAHLYEEITQEEAFDLVRCYTAAGSKNIELYGIAPEGRGELNLRKRHLPIFVPDWTPEELEKIHRVMGEVVAEVLAEEELEREQNSNPHFQRKEG